MTERAFLNVETSLTGRRWVGPSLEEDRLAGAMAQLRIAYLPDTRHEGFINNYGIREAKELQCWCRPLSLDQ